MWCVYVLELCPDEDGRSNWYVGYTESGIMRRLHEHMTKSYQSSAWVRKHGVVRLAEVVRIHNPEDALLMECGKAVEYKIKYGWKRVRGGCDNNPGDSSAAIPSYWTAPAEGTLEDDSDGIA